MQQQLISQRIFFNSNKTKSISFRIKQLKILKESIKKNEILLYNAIKKDFNKSEFETYMSELGILYADIDNNIKHISIWSKKKHVETDFHNMPAKSYIIPEPIGVSLIIGAWNYPYLLSLGPLIAAMSAGNCAILKPSEITPNSSAAMHKIISENFDQAYIAVIEGGINETSLLLKERFDKIFFTGSTKVGKIIYKAAAEHLTPVTLELGGKSPAIFDKKCNLKKSIKRLVWGKFLNAGQTCIAPDYALVHEDILEDFINNLKDEITKADYSTQNDNYVKIVDSNNLERLSNLLNESKVIIGGKVNKEQRTIEPTVMAPISFENPIMSEEIFGPILPIISYKNVEEVLSKLKILDQPLACYIFTSQKKFKNKILNEFSFGGGCINDTVMHIASTQLPFGGIGSSGMGNYHGEAGFRCFSHYKSILEKSTIFETNLKYHPRTSNKLKIIKRLLKLR